MYERNMVIFHRNFDEKKDVLALKALAEQRSILELLAKISHTLHQNKITELENEKQKRMVESEDIPFERLTRAEQSIYYHLRTKLQRSTERIDFSGLVEDAEAENKAIIGEEKENRKKSKTSKPVEAPSESESESDRPELRFKPYEAEEPPEERNRNRREDFEKLLRRPADYKSKMPPLITPLPRIPPNYEN